MSYLQGTLGFRVRAEIYLHEKQSPTKCLIFINVKEWKTISDVNRHVKTIFSIQDEVALFIDDMLLPDCETINILQKDDILRVKVSSSNAFKIQGETIEELPKEYESSSMETSTFSSGKKKKKEKKKREVLNDKATEDEITDCLMEIEMRKETLTNDKPSENWDSVEPSAADYEIGQPKQKRKRKHQKKSKNSKNIVANFDNISSCNNSYEVLNATDKIRPPKSSNRHLYFSDTDEESLSAVSGQIHREDNGESVKEIRSILTSLTNKPKSEKIFTRSCDTTSKEPQPPPYNNSMEQNLLENDSLPSTNISKDLEEMPRKGVTISFKILKMNSDYCPVISELITGRIISVEEASDKPEDKRVVLDILKGSEEFNAPNGIFSLGTEDKTSQSLYQTLNWSEIREPCIIPV